MMQKKQTQFRIVGTRKSSVVISNRATYEKYVLGDLDITSAEQLSNYRALIQSASVVLVPTVYCRLSLDTQSQVITRFYQSTLEDMLDRSGTFEEDQLINTVEVVVALLKQLAQQGLTYGMVGPTTICFYNNDLRLALGVLNQRAENESYLEADLKVLGGMILQLACKDRIHMPQEMLKQVSSNYSPQLVRLIKTLMHPDPEYRSKIFKTVSEPLQTCPVLPVLATTALLERQHNKNDSALSQSNTQYSFQYFQSKLQRLDDMVNQVLRKSKKLIQKRENKRVT